MGGGAVPDHLRESGSGDRHANNSTAPRSIAAGAPKEVTPVVVKEVIQAAPDTDTATRQTVAQMCKYIAAGADDPMVKFWAERALESYGLGRREIVPACWAVYWCVKHSVQFARDEPRLFSVGHPTALDMLIAPAVLVRMACPKEDCDGFTMLICAMLKALGIDSYIVTIAADPSDPERWSHVFPLAKLPNGETCALDASHGSFPGWMVPREHMFRWQAWTLAGAPVEVPIPSTRGLHGYVPRGRRMRRGVGDDSTVYVADPVTGVVTPIAPVTPGTDLLNLPPPVLPGSDLTAAAPVDNTNAFLSMFGLSPTPSGSPTSVASTPGTNWTSVFNNLIGGATKLTQEALLPAGGYITTNAAGQQVISTGGVPGVNLSSLGGLLPILGIGLVVVLAVSMMGKK